MLTVSPLALVMELAAMVLHESLVSAGGLWNYNDD